MRGDMLQYSTHPRATHTDSGRAGHRCALNTINREAGSAAQRKSGCMPFTTWPPCRTGEWPVRSCPNSGCATMSAVTPASGYIRCA